VLEEGTIKIKALNGNNPRGLPGKILISRPAVDTSDKNIYNYVSTIDESGGN